MKTKEIQQNWLASFREVFSKPRYIVVTLVIALMFYATQVLLFSWQGLSTFYKLRGFIFTMKLFILTLFQFNKTILLHSFITVISISILVGILFTLIIYKVKLNNPLNKKAGISSTLGLFLAAFVPGCAACGIGLVSAIGATGILISFLPFDGLEISLLSIALLSFAIFKISKDLSKPSVCKVNTQKLKGGIKNE